MRGLADLLFPARCLGCARPSKGGVCSTCFEAIPRLGGAMCGRCGRPDAHQARCADCRGRRVSFDSARQTAEFSPLLRDAVHRFKYSGTRLYQTAIAALILELAESAGLRPDVPKVITWVPASPSRLRQSGIDHGRILAELVAAALGAETTQMLRRTRSTVPQMRLSPQERRTNLTGAFTAVEAPPEQVTVIDDVYTTGSTVSEAARALKAAGCRRVDALCAARSFETL